MGADVTRATCPERGPERAPQHWRRRRASVGACAMTALSLLALLVVAGCGAASTAPNGRQTPGPRPSASPPVSAPTTQPSPLSALHAQGAQLVDAAGHNVTLRGAMIESSFAYIKSWQQGQDPTQILTPATFATMASWHMNIVRLNISYWVYLQNPNLFMSRLDEVVAAAHAAGLYVTLDYHDDKQSGDTAPDAMMRTETVTFWKIIASHYRADPMMLFDPMNEPNYPNWEEWANGNGADVVGYRQVVAAIRSVGAQQMIVLEPGHACSSCAHASWEGVSQYLPNDPNLVFSLHVYNTIISGNPQEWDATWGPTLGHYPIYYGEWGVLPHADHPALCQGLTSANADAVTNSFLAYTQARGANWTAWDFTPINLIQNFSAFTPTTFQAGAPWACEDSSAAQAGMGADVRAFLAAHP